MNAGETAKYLAWLKVTLPVMEAFAKGEEIQHSTPSQRVLPWADCTAPMWLPAHTYRVKPKPLTFFVVVDTFAASVATYRSKASADEYAEKMTNGRRLGYPFRTVKMVEENEQVSRD